MPTSQSPVALPRCGEVACEVHFLQGRRPTWRLTSTISKGCDWAAVEKRRRSVGVVHLSFSFVLFSLFPLIPLLCSPSHLSVAQSNDATGSFSDDVPSARQSPRRRPHAARVRSAEYQPPLLPTIRTQASPRWLEVQPQVVPPLVRWQWPTAAFVLQGVHARE